MIWLPTVEVTQAIGVTQKTKVSVIHVLSYYCYIAFVLSPISLQLIFWELLNRLYL